MGRLKLLETRNSPLVGYTTERHKKEVEDFVKDNFDGLSVSTWIIQIINQIVPKNEHELVN